MPARRPLPIGSVFGRLRTIGPRFSVGRQPNGKRREMVVCRCLCGQTTAVLIRSLRAGSTQSCGCLPRGPKSHRRCENPRAYNTWSSMIQRCCNPRNTAYQHYGGRGITICHRWRAFDAFLTDMGPPPPGYSIDRIDNTRGYHPENCQWANSTQQARNHRRNVFINSHGVTLTVSDWATLRRMSPRTIYNRLHRGASPEEALYRPINMPSKTWKKLKENHNVLAT